MRATSSSSGDSNRLCAASVAAEAGDDSLSALDRFRRMKVSPRRETAPATASSSSTTGSSIRRSHAFAANRRLREATIDLIEQFDRLVTVSVNSESRESRDALIAEHCDIIDAAAGARRQASPAHSGASRRTACKRKRLPCHRPSCRALRHESRPSPTTTRAPSKRPSGFGETQTTQLLAGGAVRSMPMMNLRLAAPDHIIDITDCPASPDRHLAGPYPASAFMTRQADLKSLRRPFAVAPVFRGGARPRRTIADGRAARSAVPAAISTLPLNCRRSAARFDARNLRRSALGAAAGLLRGTGSAASLNPR